MRQFPEVRTVETPLLGGASRRVRAGACHSAWVIEMDNSGGVFRIPAAGIDT
jgi:hypothetical protein